MSHNNIYSKYVLLMKNINKPVHYLGLCAAGRLAYNPEAYSNKIMRINYLDPGTTLPRQMQVDIGSGHTNPIP